MAAEEEVQATFGSSQPNLSASALAHAPGRDGTVADPLRSRHSLRPACPDCAATQPPVYTAGCVAPAEGPSSASCGVPFRLRSSGNLFVAAPPSALSGFTLSRCPLV